MKVYLYTPSRYSRKTAFRKFDDALALMLEDEGYKSLGDMVKDLYDNDVSYHFTDNYVSVDEGPAIEELELQ